MTTGRRPYWATPDGDWAVERIELACVARTEDRRPGDPYHGDGVYLHVLLGNGRHLAYVACARRARDCRADACRCQLAVPPEVCEAHGNRCRCRADIDAWDEMADDWDVPVWDLIPADSVPVYTHRDAPRWTRHSNRRHYLRAA